MAGDGLTLENTPCHDRGDDAEDDDVHCGPDESFCDNHCCFLDLISITLNQKDPSYSSLLGGPCGIEGIMGL